MDLKKCPFSDKHLVVGGNPEFVCTRCGTEWVIVRNKGHEYVLYTHFNSHGEVIKKWREPIENKKVEVLT